MPPASGPQVTWSFSLGTVAPRRVLPLAASGRGASARPRAPRDHARRRRGWNRPRARAAAAGSRGPRVLPCGSRTLARSAAPCRRAPLRAARRRSRSTSFWKPASRPERERQQAARPARRGMLGNRLMQDRHRALAMAPVEEAAGEPSPPPPASAGPGGSRIRALARGTAET